MGFCFDQFWSSGIRKVNKKKTKPLFAKILIKHSSHDGPTVFDFTNTLVADITKRLAHGQLGFYEMHPSTYLNGERWNDEIRTGGQNEPIRAGRKESLAERRNRTAEQILTSIAAREACISPVDEDGTVVWPQVGEPERP